MQRFNVRVHCDMITTIEFTGTFIASHIVPSLGVWCEHLKSTQQISGIQLSINNYNHHVIH